MFQNKKGSRKRKYFQGNISKEFVSLYSSRMIFRIAKTLLGVFLPIFLYELFDLQFRYVIYFFALRYGLYGILVGWGAKYLNRIGLRRSMRFSVFWLVLFFLVLYLLDSYTRAKTGGFEANQTEIFVLLGAALVFITLRNLMYWIPVHTDMAKFTDKSDRGKQLGLLEATSVSLKAFMPLVAGVILSFYSYDVLFLCVIFVCLSSFVPLMVIPRTDEKFEWSYRKTWAEFFSKERRKTVLAYMGDGAENVIGILVWPVFIWEVLNGNYLQVGLLSSLVILVTVLLQLTLGKLVDRRDKKKMLRFGTFFYSVGWIAKMFVVTAFHIFAASAYHNFARIFTRTPFDVLTYEKAADQGHYVDEFTVIHEMAVNLGRVVMLGVVLILVTYLPLEWTFLLGALAALALNFLTPDDVIEEGRHAG